MNLKNDMYDDIGTELCCILGRYASIFSIINRLFMGELDSDEVHYLEALRFSAMNEMVILDCLIEQLAELRVRNE